MHARIEFYGVRNYCHRGRPPPSASSATLGRCGPSCRLLTRRIRFGSIENLILQVYNTILVRFYQPRIPDRYAWLVKAADYRRRQHGRRIPPPPSTTTLRRRHESWCVISSFPFVAGLPVRLFSRRDGAPAQRRRHRRQGRAGGEAREAGVSTICLSWITVALTMIDRLVYLLVICKLSLTIHCCFHSEITLSNHGVCSSPSTRSSSLMRCSTPPV